MLATNYFNLFTNVYVNYKTVIMLPTRNNKEIHCFFKVSTFFTTNILVDLLGIDLFNKKKRWGIFSRSLSTHNSI